MGSWGREDMQQGYRLGMRGRGWLSRKSHICTLISWEEQWGSKTDCETQGFSAGKLKTQNLWL